MLQRRRTCKSLSCGKLPDLNVLNGLPVARLEGDICRSLCGGRNRPTYWKRGEEAGRTDREIMVSDRMGDAVGAGPASCRRGRGQVLDLAALTRGETEVRAAGTQCQGFHDTGAGVVI